MTIHSIPDTIQLLEILAPQLRYKDDKRADGFSSRFERGRAIHQRGNLYRVGDGIWSVPSYSNPRQRHRVALDPEDGQHTCTCYDVNRWSCCSHVYAASLAELDHKQAATAAESTEELVDLLWGVL